MARLFPRFSRVELTIILLENEGSLSRVSSKQIRQRQGFVQVLDIIPTFRKKRAGAPPALFLNYTQFDSADKIPSISVRSDSLSVMRSAPTFSSICWGREAPMIAEETFGWRRIHASASCATEAS